MEGSRREWPHARKGRATLIMTTEAELTTGMIKLRLEGMSYSMRKGSWGRRRMLLPRNEK